MLNVWIVASGVGARSNRDFCSNPFSQISVMECRISLNTQDHQGLVKTVDYYMFDFPDDLVARIPLRLIIYMYSI